MNRPRILTLALAWVLAAATWALDLDRLPFPPVAAAPPPAQLPRLAHPFALDGALDEWTQSACVPVRSPSCIAHRISAHDWRGPADSGMELYAAWNEQGLCLAAVVADDEVGNDRAEGLLWQQDCVELFLDGRQGTRFLTSPYSAGAFQLLVRPPLPGRAAAVVPIDPALDAEGLRLGARRTEVGYTLELLLPWAMFPGFVPQPRSQVGLQCGLDDWDSRDGGATQPQMMTMGGAGNLSWDPSHFVRWELVDRIAVGAGTGLGPELLVDLPSVIAADAPVHLALTAAGWLASQPRSLEAQLEDSSGAAVWQARLQSRPVAAPWEHSWEAGADLPVESLRPGRYAVTVLVRDQAGAGYGQARRDLYVLGDVLTPLYQALNQVGVPSLAERDPFRAVAYCAVPVAIERHKRAVETGNAEEAVRTQHEAVARLELLGQDRLEVDPAEDWLEWLRVGADPAAQVVVEYMPGYQNAGIAFNWGSVPMAVVQVAHHATAQAAQEAFERGQGQMGSSESTPDSVTLAGCPGRVSMAYDYEIPFAPTDYSPDRHAVLLTKGGSRLRVVDLSSLEALSPSAVALLPSCPAEAGRLVSAWAAAKRIIVTDPATALSHETALVAGDPRLPETASQFSRYSRWYELRQQRLVSLSVLTRNHVLQVSHPSRQVGEEALHLVLGGKAVTPQQVDGLRRTLVAWSHRQPSAAGAAESGNLYWGDVHAHTFYSDGATSPVAMVLEALTAYLDYLVITDHNTLDGARLAAQLLGEYHCAFPFTVGQEVTTSYAHMNAYPVREPVDWDTTAYALLKAAHAQGAVVQWNHPGFPGSEWDTAQQRLGLRGTSFDAWEHLTPLLEDWEDRGLVPVFVGSTDTHDGTFSWPERTVVRGPSAQGQDLAEAVRAGDVALYSMEGDRLLYGREDLAASIWAALGEGGGLKEEKAARLRAALRGIDLVGMLRSSQPRVVAPVQAAR